MVDDYLHMREKRVDGAEGWIINFFPSAIQLTDKTAIKLLVTSATTAR